MDFELARSTCGRLEGNYHRSVISDHSFQNSRRFVIYWNGCISPFGPIQNERRSLNGLCLPVFSILLLSLRPFHRSKWIFPAEAIPVIDMKCNRNKVAPQTRITDQSAERSLGRRTTATTFRSKQLQQLHFLWPRFKHD